MKRGEDSENVRKELGAVYGDEVFLKGNTKFLEALLKRNKLYYVKTEWEDKARTFIRARIEANLQDLKAHELAGSAV